MGVNRATILSIFEAILDQEPLAAEKVRVLYLGILAAQRAISSLGLEPVRLAIPVLELATSDGISRSKRQQILLAASATAHGILSNLGPHSTLMHDVLEEALAGHPRQADLMKEVENYRRELLAACMH